GGGHGVPGPDTNLLEKMGYETRDVALNSLGKWLIGLFVFIGVATAASFLVYTAFVPTYSEVERVSPLEHTRTLPANPQLQTRPKRDMIEYRAAEDKQLNTSTKGENNTVNLPVERAMNLLAARGISGIKGAQVPRLDTSAYPGSGIYTTRPVRSSDETAGDMTNYTNSSSAYKEGNAYPGRAGGTKPGAPQTELETPDSAKTENSSNAAPPAGGTEAQNSPR
ncbi:MAG: hypothetical protein H7Z41_17580, partial [Cytophagales bacterium]|nr:hypothetical protein [Armatimonadota bacterium]